MTSFLEDEVFGEKNLDIGSSSPHSQCSYAEISISSNFSEFDDVSILSSSTLQSQKSAQNDFSVPISSTLQSRKFPQNHAPRSYYHENRYRPRPYKWQFNPHGNFIKRRYFDPNSNFRFNNPGFHHLPNDGKTRTNPNFPRAFTKFQHLNPPPSEQDSRSSTPMPPLVTSPIFAVSDAPGPSWTNSDSESLRSSIKKKEKRRKLSGGSVQQSGIQTVIRHASPGCKLSEDQGKFLQSQLIEALDRTSKLKSPPCFLKSYYDQGAFWMVCADEITRQWLIQNVELLNRIWDDMNLKVETVKIPKRPIVYVDLQDLDKTVEILDRLAIQNEGLHTESWIVLNRQVFNSRQRIIFSIDLGSFEYLKSKNFIVAWKLKTIVFKVPSKAIKSRAGKWVRGMGGPNLGF